MEPTTQQSSDRQLIRKGVALLSSSALLSNGLYLLRTLILVRHFGPEKYGLITLLIGIPQLFTMFLVNTDYYVVTYLPAEIRKRSEGLPSNAGQLVSTSYFVRAAIWLLLGLIVVLASAQIAAFIRKPETVTAVVLIGIMIAANCLQGPADHPLLNSFQLYRQSAVLEILSAVGPLFVAGLTWAFDLDVVAYLGLSILGEGVQYGYSLFVAATHRKLFWDPRDRTSAFSWPLAKTMIRFSYPLTIRRTVLEAYLAPLRFLVARWLDLTALGYFSLVYNLYGKLTTLALVLLKPVLPYLNQAVDREQFLERYRRVFPNLNFFYMQAALGLICFSPEIIFMLGGKAFLGAIPLFTFLSFYFYVIQIAVLSSVILNFFGQTFLSLSAALVRVSLVLSLAAFGIYVQRAMGLLPVAELASVGAMWFFTGAVAFSGVRNLMREPGTSLTFKSLALLGIAFAAWFGARQMAGDRYWLTLVTGMGLFALFTILNIALHSQASGFAVVSEGKLLLRRLLGRISPALAGANLLN